jgi:tripartite-type tricarboxylate transporter receptor subunit TctC
MITKRRLLSLASTGGLAAIFPDATRTAAAETASRMLVGFGAGGAIDVIARMLVEGMKDYAPSFIVDNRPGAGGRLALGVLKSSPARRHRHDPGASLQFHRVPTSVQDAGL